MLKSALLGMVVVMSLSAPAFADTYTVHGVFQGYGNDTPVKWVVKHPTKHVKK